MRITAEKARQMAGDLEGLAMIYKDIEYCAKNGLYKLSYDCFNDDTNDQRKYLLNSEKAIQQLKIDGYKVKIKDRQIFPYVVISW